MRLTCACALAVLAGLMASGCSSADGTEPHVASDAPALSGPATDPCGLLTDAEVRKVFPDAERGRLDRRLEAHGIVSCLWDHPGGQFIAQFFKGEPAAVEDEIRSRASGFVDPVKPGARANVRYETLAGVGDRAVAAIERADNQTGILSDFALLVVRRGNRQVAFQSTQLAARERAAALEALEGLGRAAAKRM